MHRTSNILITGANGLIGSSLCHALIKKGYTVRTLSRRHGDFKWEPASGYIDTGALNGIDCVIHLAGEPIAQRWTNEAKEQILGSRVSSTQLLAKEISKHQRYIKFICASGINYYGSDTSEPVTEQAKPGKGFLAHVCKEWEKAIQKCDIEEVCNHATFIRTGIALSPNGGALKKMLSPFKAGMGGRMGSGRQMMSWISLEDIVNVYINAVEDNTLNGAINAVAPSPVTNSEFTVALANTLHRPAFLPVPAFMINMLFGQMGKETILANLNVVPEILQQSGFKWKHTNINDALHALLFQL